jgi:lipopolysaccharide transport system permease protein
MQSEITGLVQSAHPAAVEVPGEPLLVITPSGRWAGLDLRGFWTHRDLLYFLAWRDVKIRYKQTALGVAWAMLQPLLTMLIFTLFFGKVAKIPSEGLPYALFAYAGLTPWTFFANAITNSGNSLVMNSNLISKIYFPRLIVPSATVLAGLVDLIVSLALIFGLFAYYGVWPDWNILALPLLVAATALLALAIGLFFSALNVKYRDMRYALPFLVQLGMFATPIIYPSSMAPERWRWLLSINPMTGIVEGFRAALLGGRFDGQALFISGSVTVALLIAGAYYFRSVEKSFADVV